MIGSIDIGIKNFCLCLYEPKTNKIVDWIHTSLKSGPIQFDTDAFHNLFKLFDSIDWSTTTHILVEKQMMFGNKKNISAYRLQCYVMCYFLLKFPDIKVIEYPAYHKTKVLGGKHKMTKPQRKKWTIEYTLNHVEKKWLDFFSSHTKKDDLADTWCMIQAYKIQHPFLFRSS